MPEGYFLLQPSKRKLLTFLGIYAAGALSYFTKVPVVSDITYVLFIAIPTFIKDVVATMIGAPIAPKSYHMCLHLLMIMYVYIVSCIICHVIKYINAEPGSDESLFKPTNISTIGNLTMIIIFTLILSFCFLLSASELKERIYSCNDETHCAMNKECICINHQFHEGYEDTENKCQVTCECVENLCTAT